MNFVKGGSVVGHNNAIKNDILYTDLDHSVGWAGLKCKYGQWIRDKNGTKPIIVF